MTNEDNLKKLKQLDRIEFMLRKNELEKKIEGDSFLTNAYLFIGILAFTILLGSIWIGLGYFENVAMLLTKARFVLSIIGVIIMLGICYDIARVLNYLIKKKQLYSEFFKVEAKK